MLGVSAQYHDAAAALVIDGQIVAAASEERFTRKKGDASVPENAIDYVLSAGGIEPSELDACVFYESPFAKFDRIVSTQTVGRGGLPLFVRSLGRWVPEKLWIARQLRDVLGDKTVDVLYGDHHLSHAASAFYPSPFEHAASLTVDGVGEWTTTAIARGIGERIEFVEQIEYPNSLGLLYSAFTLYCGFKVNSGEYKLMGLAPYGTPRYATVIETELVHVHDDGSFALNPKYFAYTTSARTYNKHFEDLLGGPGRGGDDPLTERHADIAASIQAVTNKIMLGLVHRTVAATGLRDLCLAGGVALNVVSIGEIERSGLIDRVWVQPAAGDAGGALGAALWASHEIFAVPRFADDNDATQGAFLGPTPGTDEQIEELLADYGIESTQLDDDALRSEVAALVAQGNIVGVARGRMEYGPRALGARSILADARDPEMQLRLNLKTKFREGFRPFAPIVSAERAHEYFDTDGRESPYMLKTYPVTDRLRLAPVQPAGSDVYAWAKIPSSTIPAVTHVDYSARVQTVDRRRNPFMHGVLERFETLTGCAVIVNTSFNVRGEPIVCSAEDALECFLRNDIDALVLGSRLIQRRQQRPDSLRPRRSTSFEAD